MLEIQRLSENLNHLQKLTANTSLANAFDKAEIGETPGVALRNLATSFASSRDEVMRAQFKHSEKTEKYLSFLSFLEERLFDSAIKRDPSKSAILFQEQWLASLAGIVDVLSEAIEGSTASIDRLNFAAATEELIQSVQSWEMDEFLRGTLILQLTTVLTMSQSDRMLSDRDLRNRVKGLLCDFAFQFSEYDKKFETKFETLKRWAVSAFSTAPTAIGIASDASTIAGLLPKP